MREVNAKRLFFVMLGVVLFMTQSCITHNYYYYGSNPEKKDVIRYDRSAPDIRKPVMAKESNNYNAMDYKTFAVFTKPHTVEAPTGDSAVENYAIWCTKKGTYLATVSKMLWNRRYYNNESSMYLRDSSTGKRYPLRKVWGLPMDETYWMSSVAGEWFCVVYEFPPLMPECTEIDIIQREGEPLKHIPGTTGWGNDPDELNLSVSRLQANQHKMKYKPTVIVK